MTFRALLQAVIALLIGADPWFGLSGWMIRVDRWGETELDEVAWEWLIQPLAFLASFGGSLTMLRGAGERGSAQEAAARVLAGIAGVLAAVDVSAAVVAVARRAPTV